MSDPWREFQAAADRAEVAGYFERATGSPGAPGSATWFTRPDGIVTVDPRSRTEEIASLTEGFVDRERGRAVMGYLGFDAVELFEPALHGRPSGSPFPLGEFALVSKARTARVPARPPPRRRAIHPLPNGRDSLPRARFGASVQRLRRAIREGDSYQVVLAHRRTWERPTDLLARATNLRTSERYAFFFYLRFGDREIVGASPESVVEVDGRDARVNPIAGTLPTGGTRRGRQPLEADRKELAEHRMLVDLARNDLGRVAIPGTVRLIERERRVRYARLDHLVSRVGARLAHGVGPWQALAATFPAGTVSGAPKIRSTELLRREEATWRGPYAGAVGLIRGGQRADWALTIRSAFGAGRNLYTAAGAGIVYRSDPAREFHETLVKLAHVEDALVGDRR